MWLQTEPMETRERNKTNAGKRTMVEEEKNKLLVLVTYTIKTGCVKSPFFPRFHERKRALLLSLFFIFGFHVCTHTKKVRFPTAVPIPQRRSADNILASALICPFWTFLTPSASVVSPFPRSVVLVDASRRKFSGDVFWPCAVGRSVIVSNLRSFGDFLVRCLRAGGELKLSPTGLECWLRGNSLSTQGMWSMTEKKEMT